MGGREAMSRFPESCWAVLSDGEAGVIGHVALTFRIWYADDAWQGVCAELRVPSFGGDPGDALTNVIDATIEYLNEIEETGERERVFTERGVKLRQGLPEAESPISEFVDANVVISRLELGLRPVA